MKRTSVIATGKRRVAVEWDAPSEFAIPIPKNEPQRLATLHRFQILDTLPEDEFDDITLLASQICHTPIALISLVDSDRQWFKSRIGLSFSETSRDIAFCAHAIMQRELFIVPDASKDKRFTKNPLVAAEPKIRFYAGAPLFSSDNHALGTLCVLDKVPRELTSGQKEALRILSRSVMARLEMRERVRELEEAQRETPVRQGAQKKPSARKRSDGRVDVQFLRKAAHQVRSTASAIVAVAQRALEKPCTPEQHDLLRTALSSADSLLALARDMKSAAGRE
jgi:GAF domain-containing protein